MTDIQHIDVDSDEFEGTPKALRDHVKRLQKALNDVSAERDGFRNQINENALGSVLAGFKNPERVKTAILGDKVNPLDNEAVAKWLTDNGDDYAKAVEAPATPAETQSTTNATDPRAAAQERLNALQQIASPGSADELAVINSMPQDLPPAEAWKWLAERA